MVWRINKAKKWVVSSIDPWTRQIASLELGLPQMTSADLSVKHLKFADDNNHLPHPRQWGVSTPMKGSTSVSLVLSEQPGPERTENCGDDSDFRRSPSALPPIPVFINSFRCWNIQVSGIHCLPKVDCQCIAVKKAQQRMFFLQQLRKLNLPQQLLINFYIAIIKSVICISHQTGEEKTDNQKFVGKKITGAKLPSMQDLHTSGRRKYRCRNRVGWYN